MFLRKLFRLLLLLLLVVTAILAGGFYWLKSRGLPQRQGSAMLSGLAAPVDVRWDSWAMPYVRASGAPTLVP